jgi:hypothetical protein
VRDTPSQPPLSPDPQKLALPRNNGCPFAGAGKSTMTNQDPNQRLERDPRNYDRDSDGISSHKGGLGNHGPNWISNNVGKIIVGGVITAIVMMVILSLTD